jgi:DNA-binding HxlR family transcriptional regulator
MMGERGSVIDLLRETTNAGSEDKALLDVSQKLFHPYRILIMKTLLLHSESEFQELKHALSLTDGNLASHLRALESEGYTGFRKEIEGRKVKTYYHITKDGIAAFTGLANNLTDIFEKMNANAIQ